ncbi:MAG: hypothetical protein JNK12_20810 [Acidimicrobiales bacterium]|nr:hypothetical protein [Acidimicrobiales bacterium]
MAPVEERPSSVYDALVPRGSVVLSAVVVASTITWMAVVAPRLEGRASWAATPWPPLVLGMVAMVVHTLKRHRRELEQAGIERGRSGRVVGRALRTGRLPDDRSHDDAIRARVRYARLQTGELTRRSWVIFLVVAAMSLTRGLVNHEVFDLGLAAVCVVMAPVAWRMAPRTVAKWDRLAAELDARRPAPPPEVGD